MKIWAIGASIAAAVFLGAAVFLQFKAANQIGGLESEQRSLRSQLADSRADREDAESRREEAERRLADLDRELAASKARVTNLSAQLRQSQLEARQLAGTVSGLEADKQSLQDQAGRLRRELLDARTQPPLLANEEREALEEEIADLRGRLAQIREEQATRPSPAAVQILSVSDRGDVIAFDRGRRHGLAPDKIVLLRHGQSPLARLRLADVREEWTIAHVLERETGQTLAKGTRYSLVVTP